MKVSGTFPATAVLNVLRKTRLTSGNGLSRRNEMIGPYELETEWVDSADWSPHPDDAYERKGYYSYVGVFEYRKVGDRVPNQACPVLERSNPSWEEVEFLRDAVNALNKEAAVRRDLMNDHGARVVAEAFKAFAKGGK
jgi:hypothetical protein